MEGPTLAQPWAQFGLTATGKQKKKRVRSVMGCITCRKRRVKCDEKRPKCTNCLRHPLRVCEYEYESNEVEDDKDQMDMSSATTSFIESSSSASSSKLTLDEFIPSERNGYGYSLDYEGMLKERHTIEAMAAELQSLGTMDPILDPESSSLADAFITKLPDSKLTRFSSVLSFHTALIRRCLSSLSEDPHSRLLYSATAVLTPTSHNAANPGMVPIVSHLHRPDIYKNWVRNVREKKDNVITGKLGAVAFTLLMCEIMDPSPSAWREQLNVMLAKSIDRGGPGWLIGVSPPLPGYKGGQLDNRQPLSMALYSEMAAMIEVYACLTTGAIPTLLTCDRNERRPWLLASRACQTKVSPTIPDSIEVIFGLPRIMTTTFAQVTALVAKKNLMGTEDFSLKENLDFEIASIRLELEHVWPPRLENRRDERRLQYGGRLWRLAILIFLLQEAQHYPTASLEVITHVGAFFELCQEAVVEIGHLAGWLWPILLAACASCSHAQREGFLRLLPFAKGPIGDRDNSEHVHKLLTMVWFYQDTGDSKFHIREALRIDNSLDLLIL